MPLIAYQSFNSNSSKSHGLASINMQHFTKLTNSHVTRKSDQALVLPLDPSNLAEPIEGPANLVPIRPLAQQSAKKRKREADDSDSDTAKVAKTGEHTMCVFGSQISSLWQHFNRQFGEMPSIMVCGELDYSNSDFQGLIGGGVSVDARPATKACQSFTAITRNGVAATFLGSGDGFVAYEIVNLNVVFVHVPNAICRDGDKVAAFYKTIAQTVLSTGKMIHLVIGDTNQSRSDFTKDVLNTAFQTDAYRNAFTDKSITKIDNYGVTEGGSNSTGTKLFDVAVYHSGLVDVKKDVAYLSQSSNAVTVTDHCGLGIAIELKGKT